MFALTQSVKLYCGSGPSGVLLIDADGVHQIKTKLKKAQHLITDMQQSCSQQRQVTSEANKRSRLALNDVCT